MKVIYKYTLRPELVLDIPKGAEILSVHDQGCEICLWALVDPKAEKEQRKFVSFGTGYDIPDIPGATLKFIGTTHLYSDSLVFHVFELIVQIEGLAVTDGQSLSNAGLERIRRKENGMMLSAAEINEFCELAFGRSADMGDLRIFDFARLVEGAAGKNEREACARLAEVCDDQESAARFIRARSN